MLTTGMLILTLGAGMGILFCAFYLFEIGSLIIINAVVGGLLMIGLSQVLDVLKDIRKMLKPPNSGQ